MDSMEECIKTVIDRFLLCHVRSEEEVRSKLIVPLLEALGYEPHLRGEGYPVYSFIGRKRQATTSADFILFDDSHFNEHAKFTQNDLDWVHDHSLLVVEAKKPGEIPDVPGQAKFYSVWTKALAYLLIDGVTIKGWVYQNGCSDKLLIDCHVGSISDYNSFLSFGYEKLVTEKHELINSRDYRLITDIKELNLPEEIINNYRNIMGKNGQDLDDLQLIAEFLHTSDYIISSKMRYGIPSFAIDLPREVMDSLIYCDKDVFPKDSGKVAHSYWEDVDRYQFNSEILMMDVFVKKEEVSLAYLRTTDLYNQVEERIDAGNKILDILNSGHLIMTIPNNGHLSIGIMENNNQLIVDDIKRSKEMFIVWLEGLEHMKTIEEYYGIRFNLTEVDDARQLYQDVEQIYDGINKSVNATKTVVYTKEAENFELQEPFIICENKRIDLEDKVIFGIRFRPYRTMLLPGKYKVSELKKGDSMVFPVCCEYKIIGVDEES